MLARLATVLVAVSFGLALLAAAGCGGDSESSSPPISETTAETTTATTETTEETETTDTGETETTEVTETTTSSIPFSSGKCKELAQSASNLSAAFTGGSADFKKSAELFQDFADQVPSEIKDDVQTLADALNKYAEALEGVDLTSTSPDPETLQKLQKLSEELDQQKIQDASTNIAAWVQDNCT